MASVANEKGEVTAVDARVLARIVEEGYGPGAWHGPDMKAALADDSAAQAFWRPAPGRHNIAEIALHHAYCVRSVRVQITGETPEAFVLEGEDWFALDDERVLAWTKVKAVLEDEQRQLASAVAALARPRAKSPLPEDKRFALVLGVACHGVYHAGQVQLVKRLRA